MEDDKRPVTAASVMDTTTTTTIPINNNNDLSIVVAVPPVTTKGEKDSINGEKNNKKKRSGGGFNFLKAAMLMFRPSKNQKPNKPFEIQLDDEASNRGGAAGNNWKKIVGSMRPLHLQDNSSMPLSPSPKSPRQLTVVHSTANIDVDDQNHDQGVEHFEDVIAAPVSPTPSTSSTFADSTSVYGSAMNLQELDNHRESDDDDKDDEDEDEDQVFDNKPADAMIDVKAEEFIAHFYAQMRHQQLASASHYHHRRNST